MIDFNEALKKGYEEYLGAFRFKFGEDYELWFEPLLFDQQHYVALYKNKELLTDKVVIKPGRLPEGVSVPDLSDWKTARQNLKNLVEKYPNTLQDALDSAYVAGLDTRVKK